MDAIEVELSPGSTVRAAPAHTVHHHTRRGDESIDRVSRDGYYYCYDHYNHRCRATTTAATNSATAPWPQAGDEAAGWCPRAGTPSPPIDHLDESPPPSPLLMELELDAILRGGRSGERDRGGGGSSTTVSHRAVGAAPASPVEPTTSAVTGGLTAVLLRPPPPLTYLDPARGNPTAAAVPYRVLPTRGAATATTAQASGVPVARQPADTTATATRLCAPRGRRSTMRESIARFLGANEMPVAAAAIVRRGGSAGGASPLGQARARASVSTASSSSPPPRAPVAAAESAKTPFAARARRGTGGSDTPRRALFAPLPLNSASSSAISKTAAARTAVTAASPAPAQTRSARSEVQRPRRTLNTQPVAAAETRISSRSPSAAADESITRSLVTSLDTATVRVFDGAAMTVVCAACQLSIRVFAFFPAGAAAPLACHCPLCGHPCAWTPSA
ncbi:hypothetical protein NESM_000157700 [Novymonas esmeraldas]|uniref:Uncharacterized protein n=1 Tax=Novymonas esmeraldas TaxID=1808958 RepID=A0AAW0F3Z5_9TRYP